MFQLSVTLGVDAQHAVRLVVSAPLDRETRDTYRLTLLALDGGRPTHTGTMLVTVCVTDTNDNTPRFDEDVYEIWITENVPRGARVPRDRASDPDQGPHGRDNDSLGPPAGAGVFEGEETGWVVVRGRWITRGEGARGRRGREGWGRGLTD